MVPAIGRLTALILTLLAPALTAGDWYVSYRLHSDRFVIVSEHLFVSKAMVPFNGRSESVCTFVTEARSFETFAREEEQRLLECLFEHGVIVQSREKILDMVHDRESLELILPPTPLQVEFNDGLVIIKKVTGH